MAKKYEYEFVLVKADIWKSAAEMNSGCRKTVEEYAQKGWRLNTMIFRKWGSFFPKYELTFEREVE